MGAWNASRGLYDVLDDSEDPEPEPPHVCHFEQAARGDHERCKCGERFPCRDADCGHLDCVERRGVLSLCYHCRKRVTGPPAGIRRPGSPVAELREWDDEGTWTRWTVWGHTRTVHFKCRDERAKPEELARWYGTERG